METLVNGDLQLTPSLAAAPRASSHITEQPLLQLKAPTQPKSLLDLAAVVVATGVDVDETAFHLDYLPANVRHTLLYHMQDDRLRLLECAFISGSMGSPQCPQRSALVPVYEFDFQHEWRRRCEAQGYHVAPAISTDTLFRESAATTGPRNARRVFWEHHFRNLVRAKPVAISGDQAMDQHVQANRDLYQDVVETLKLNARDLTPSNLPLILQLPLLRRLELHHLSEQHKSQELAILEKVVLKAASLQELCFFHGRLSASTIDRISTALVARSSPTTSVPLPPVISVEFISVKLKVQADHRQLVTLFERCKYLTSVRISSTISDFSNQRLVSVLMGLPQLESLSLEHNDLEDEAFADINSHKRLSSRHSDGSKSTPLSLKCLRLGSNALSAVSMQTLSSLVIDGQLPALERLELRGNQELGDAGIHSIAPMLLATDSRLTHLDLRNCHFGLEGALTLLSALDANSALRSLDLSQNFFGSGFGDVLADFLLTNESLQRLHVNYVGLGHAGCTERLQLALRTNSSLRVFSVGANRLRDQGATLLLSAIATRSRSVPYEAVDFSGNLLTVDGLLVLKSILQGETGDEENEEPPAKRQRRSDDGKASCRIDNLGLLNNDLAGCGDATARAEDAVRSLGRLVGKVFSNEWTTRRNVYDDEV